MEQSLAAKKWLDRAGYFLSILLSRWINRGKDPKNLIFKNILCFKEDEIGDFIYAMPVFEVLHRIYPEAKITVLCKPVCVALLKHSPSVYKTVSSYEELTGDYDLMIDLRGTASSLKYALMHRPAFRLDRGTVRYRNRRRGAHPHELETNRSIIQPLLPDEVILQEPVLWLGSEERETAQAFLLENGIENGRFAIFHTGARTVLKKWPLDRVAMVMKYVHFRLGLQCILAGDEKDLKDASALREMLDFPLIVAAGKLSLPAFSALCEKAALYIGNDSGPLHIASVTGIPAIGLYGPGDPVFHPRGARSGYLHHILECNPCDQNRCKYPANPCIRRIEIAEVIQEIGRVIPTGPQPA